MNVRGIETGTCPFGQRISACPSDFDVFVIFLMRCEPGALPLVRQRMVELRSQSPRIPAVALVEDADTEGANFAGMGFSSVVLGLPSVSFAVDVVQLLLLGSRRIREFDLPSAIHLPLPDSLPDRSKAKTATRAWHRRKYASRAASWTSWTCCAAACRRSSSPTSLEYRRAP